MSCWYGNEEEEEDEALVKLERQFGCCDGCMKGGRKWEVVIVWRLWCGCACWLSSSALTARDPGGSSYKCSPL